MYYTSEGVHQRAIGKWLDSVGRSTPSISFSFAWHSRLFRPSERTGASSCTVGLRPPICVEPILKKINAHYSHDAKRAGEQTVRKSIGKDTTQKPQVKRLIQNGPIANLVSAPCWHSLKDRLRRRRCPANSPTSATGTEAASCFLGPSLGIRRSNVRRNCVI